MLCYTRVVYTEWWPSHRLPVPVVVVLSPIYAHRDRPRANRFAMIIARTVKTTIIVFLLSRRCARIKLPYDSHILLLCTLLLFIHKLALFRSNGIYRNKPITVAALLEDYFYYVFYCRPYSIDPNNTVMRRAGKPARRLCLLCFVFRVNCVLLAVAGTVVWQVRMCL